MYRDGKKMDKNAALQGLNHYRALELPTLPSSGLHRRLFKFKPFGLNLTALPVRDNPCDGLTTLFEQPHSAYVPSNNRHKFSCIRWLFLFRILMLR